LSQIYKNSSGGGGSGIITIAGDSGTATGSVVTISGGSTGITTTASGSTVVFTGTLNAAQYVNVTAATQAMAANTFYISNNAGGLLVFTPPAVCPVGSVFAIQGNNAGGWSLNLTTNSQTFNFGANPATTAIASNNRFDSIQFVCTVANTTFGLIDSVGNLLVS